MGRKLIKKTSPSSRKDDLPKQQTKHKSPVTPLRTSPLLGLPGEVRNRIYNYILSQHTFPTTLSLHRDLSSPSVFRPSPPQPLLARTCRQLRHEVLSLSLGARTFSLDREIGIQNLIST